MDEVDAALATSFDPSAAECLSNASNLNNHLNFKRPVYQEGKLIGSGAYGKVYESWDASGKLIAIKKVHIQFEDQGIPLSSLRELAVLKKLQKSECHPNLVVLLDVGIYREGPDHWLYLAFEYVEQDLQRFLERYMASGVPATTVKDFTRDLLSGIDFLHSKRILHRDLKPANILVARAHGRHKLKITDFGLSRVLGFECGFTSVVVTLWYRSPEVLLKGEYSSPCDLWSVGCIVAEMVNSRPLFRGDTDVEQITLILDMLGLPQDAEWPTDSLVARSNFRSFEGMPNHLKRNIFTRDARLLDLIVQLLQFSPLRRITAKQALEHPFFQLQPAVMAALPGWGLSDSLPVVSVTAGSGWDVVDGPLSVLTEESSTSGHLSRGEGLLRMSSPAPDPPSASAAASSTPHDLPDDFYESVFGAADLTATGRRRGKENSRPSLPAMYHRPAASHLKRKSLAAAIPETYSHSDSANKRLRASQVGGYLEDSNMSFGEHSLAQALPSITPPLASLPQQFTDAVDCLDIGSELELAPEKEVPDFEVTAPEFEPKF